MPEHLFEWRGSPVRTVSNRGKDFVLPWDPDEAGGQSASTRGVVRAVPPFVVAVVATAVCIYGFVAGGLVDLLTIAGGAVAAASWLRVTKALTTFEVLRVREKRIGCESRSLWRAKKWAERVVDDVEIVTPYIYFTHSRDGGRHGCALLGFEEPIFLASTAQSEEIAAYLQRLPSALQERVRDEPRAIAAAIMPYW